MKHALVLAPFAEPELVRLRKSLRVTYESWLDTRRLYDPEELARRLRDEHVAYLVVEGDFVFDDVMEQAADLQLIGVCRNGLNHIDLDAATERGILVVNAPGRNSIAVAELTVGLVLSIARRIPQADAFIKAGRWDDPVSGYLGFRGVELAGKTAGIVGLGAIGRMVAQRLAAFDMRLIAHDPFIAHDRLGDLPVKLLPLNDVLTRADYLLIHAPANEATMGLIGQPQLARMKRSAYLINASAPGVVNEEALTEAFQSHRIAGAALDVFEGQPLPESSPLLALPNIVLTPHIGGATIETVERQSAMIAEDILLTLAGKRPVRLVNQNAWEKRSRTAKDD